VLFEFSKDKLTLAATDSYRLTQTEFSIKNSTQLSVIVPVKTAYELIRLISGEENGVKIEVSSTEIVFNYGPAKLISRLIEGKYPDYKQIFPQSPSTTINIDKDVITQSVKVSSLFAKESSNTIKLNVEKDKIIILTNTSEVGENKSEIPTKINGKSLSIQLNSRYVLNSLNAINSTAVTIELTGELNPCIIKPKNNTKQKNTSIHVIMPLRN